jgi:hypothetical protein
MTTITGRPSFPFYHKQLEDNYCGPACAQMILESLGVFEIDQARIAAAGDSPASATNEESPYKSWFTRPDELVIMLQVLAPVADRTFAQRRSNPPANPDAFRGLLKCLVEDQSIPPPVVPVQGLAGHWVVLFQYQVNGPNRSFFGYNPYSLKDSHVVPNKPVEINIADQNRNFRHARNFVAIAKSPNVFARALARNEIEVFMTSGDGENISMEQEGGGIDTPPSSASGQFPPQRIQQQVVKELIAYGVIDPDDTNGILTNASPGTPLLVKVPGAPSDDYYLVGLQNSSKKNHLLVRLDAYDGQYLDSLSIPPTEYLLGKSAIESKVYQKVYEQLVIEMKKESWFRAFEMELSRTTLDCIEEPNFIWVPCNESQSPFYPFYEVRDGQTMFYVRIDGAVFPTLTTARGKGKSTIRK